MNLNKLAAKYVGVVNPDVECKLLRSKGYGRLEDGTQTPEYYSPDRAMCAFQPVTNKDLQHIEGMNIQGDMQSVYINGDWVGVIRPARKGGDIIKHPNGSTWLITAVVEMWSDWTKVIVTLQNNK